MLPEGIGRVSGAFIGVLNEEVAGITFKMRFSVAGPPGQSEPPADPVPPDLLQTVVTLIENVSCPVNVGVGGV
jgi:hypothetical protein